jgi:hypothetical protein
MDGSAQQFERQHVGTHSTTQITANHALAFSKFVFNLVLTFFCDDGLVNKKNLRQQKNAHQDGYFGDVVVVDRDAAGGRVYYCAAVHHSGGCADWVQQ